VFSAWSAQSGYKEVFSGRSSSEVEICVEFWTWQSKVIEKKWQEKN
jgi:hypothetical protein